MEKGSYVRVVRGRKVPRGTEGFIFWIDVGRYGERCGLKDAAGVTHWTATSNVEVVDAPPGVAEARAAEVAAWKANKDAEAAAVRAEIESGTRPIPRKGSVVSFRSPGLNLGDEVTGEVFWHGQTRAGSWRVGIKNSFGETFWKGENEVTVVQAA